MPDPVRDRYVVLGVSGSIAAYKAVDLASRLVQAGARVDVVMTAAATKFVTPLSFGSITHRPVVDDLWDRHSELAIEHVGLAKRAAAILVAPATADLLAKMAYGFADDPLLTTLLDTRARLPRPSAPKTKRYCTSSPPPASSRQVGPTPRASKRSSLACCAGVRESPLSRPARPAFSSSSAGDQ